MDVPWYIPALATADARLVALIRPTRIYTAALGRRADKGAARIRRNPTQMHPPGIFLFAPKL